MDTTILPYGISDRPDEAAKWRIVDEPRDHVRNGLSVRGLHEFCHQATRPTRTRTGDIRKASGYSYWGSAIIAAAAELGCAEVKTHRVAGIRLR